MKIKYLIASFLLSASLCSIAQPKLVKDFTPGTGESADRWNYKATKFGEALFFPISSPTDGKELAIADYDNLKVLKDINSGQASSNPQNMTVFNGKLYFSAFDVTNGTSIWSTDGTEGGTKIEINFPGNADTKIANLVVTNSGKLYFTFGGELYVVDGNLYTKLDSGLSLELDNSMCTYDQDIAYLKKEGTAMSLFLVENSGIVKKASFANDIGSFATIFGMTQVDNGIVLGIDDFSDVVEGVYSFNKTTNAVSKITFGGEKLPLRINRLNSKLALAAVNTKGYYAINGKSSGNTLIYETTSLSFTQGIEIDRLMYKDKLLFIGNVEGFFGDPKLFFTNGTVSGTKVLKDFSNDLISNIVMQGNYGFFADNTSNGFKPNFISVNLDNNEVTTFYSSSLPSNQIESVLMLGVIKDRLYFLSNLDPAVGRELYYINHGATITSTKEISNLTDVSIKIMGHQFEIQAPTRDGNVVVQYISMDGQIIKTDLIQMNNRYDLPKQIDNGIISLTIDNQVLSTKFVNPK